MPDKSHEFRESVAHTDRGDIRRQTVTEHDATAPSRRGEQVVYLILGIVESFLGIRFILSLLGANRGNAFADLIYDVSFPFVAPFFGLFGYEVEYGVARLEVETLVAMLVYALIAYGIAKLFRIGRT